MRVVVAALLVVLPIAADAQSSRKHERQPERKPEPPAATLPPIGLPLPPIGLPLAPLGMAPPTETQSPRPPARRSPPRRGHGRGRGGGVIYVLPAVPPVAESAAAGEVATTSAAAEASPSGTLVLDVTPPGVGEVFVDGYLVGTSTEVNGALEMPSGPHRIEVRADGYEPLTVDVRIETGGSVTLRRSLEARTDEPVVDAPASPSRLAAPPAKAAPAAERKPFYLIPGCYMGNVPPKDAGLPASCDLSKTVVVRP